MSPTREATVLAYEHTCRRCAHTWWTFTPAPKSCAKCKSKQWDKERERAPRRDKRALRNERYRKAQKAKARAAKKAEEGR